MTAHIHQSVFVLPAALVLLVVSACSEQQSQAPGSDSDPAEQVRYWAEQGAPVSQLQLAEMYEQGFGIEQDSRQAAFWLRRAARSGHVAAQERLAEALTLGELELEVDLERAAYWWQQAAFAGSSRSLVEWAYVHFNGDAGYNRNCGLAVSLLEGPSEELDDNELLNALAWILATCPDFGHRDGPRAIALMMRVMDNHGDRVPAYVDTLAAAYAEAGEFERAVEMQQDALDLLPEDVPGDLLAEFEQRLALYRDGRAFRIAADSDPDADLVDAGSKTGKDPNASDGSVGQQLHQDQPKPKSIKPAPQPDSPAA